MADTFTFTLKPIADLSDIKANVGEIQKAFSKLTLPDKITGKLTNEIAKFEKAYGIVQKKMAEGIKTPGDLNQIQRNNNLILDSWNEIFKIIHEVSGLDLNGVLKFDTQSLQDARKQLADLEKQLNNITLNKTQNNQLKKAIEDVQAQTKSAKVQDLTKGMLDGLNEKNFIKVFDNYNKLKQHHAEFINMFGSKTTTAITTLGTTLQQTTGSTGDLTQKISEARQEIERLEQAEESGVRAQLENGADAWNKETAAVQKYTESVEDAGKAELELSKNAQVLERQVESYFGLNAIFRKVATMARDAMQTVKELDKAMTETAVVTDFSVSDMWEKLPIYTAEANKLGSSIKDVYEATTLYYQQGLNTTQSMGLAVETLKMARIAGMDAKDATDAMTAALRGFNLEINQTSAKRINDVYSELAAITASNTQEISTAMEKVASLAHNAGMEVETTSAFLAQMIETTREAPENLGTALKTVVARFQEMKQDPTKLIDSEGVMLDANKVDKALKSIGVNLTDANGEFRKLDDVFLEIASKWDSLSKGQQRYIATMAAGSRQQSRFIAMMSNYERTMELVDAANNAAGASQKQFEKTLESMDTKLNQLKNAWDQFTMGLMNNDILKGVVDFGKEFLDTVNNIINSISGGNGLIKSIITLIATFGGLTGARTILSAGISGGFKWFKGELDTKGLFTNILLSGRKNIQEQFSKAGVIGADNFEKGFRGRFQKNFQQGFQYSLRNLDSGPFKQALLNQVPDKLISDVSEEQVRNSLKGYMAQNDTAKWANTHWNSMNKDQLVDYAKANGVKEIAGVNLAAVESFEKLNTAAGKFAVGTTKAGSALQSFGLLLRGTPLAPFGMALQVAGSSLSSFGQLFIQVGKNGEILNTGLAAVKANLAGFAPYIAVFAALAAVITIVYFAVTENKRRLEALSKVAQDASNNLDTLKQNTTEFKNSLEEIQANKDAFKNLVPGTIEFNEKLIESNQLILDLINKYEELKGKLRVDEFGRYFIADDDLNEFYETLQHRQQIGQSLSLLTDFAVTEEKVNQEIDKINDSYQEILRPKYGHDNDKGVPIPSKEDLYKEADNIAYAKASEEAAKEIAEKQRQLEIQKQATYSAAIQGAIAGLDIDNSSTANILAQQYQKYLKDVGVLTTEEAIEIYARQNNMSTADVASNDDLKKFAIKEAPTIKALQNIYDSAEKVDNILESVDQNVYSIFEEEFGDNKTFFTDLFSRNELTNTELLKQFNLNKDWSQKMIDSLTDEMVLEFEPEFNEESIDEAREALKNDLEEAGQDLLEIQKPIYTDFATLYMRSGAASKANPNKFGNVTALYEASTLKENIEEDLKQISVEKAKFITEVASELETHVGNDATAEFMSNAVSIYSSGVSTRIQELETILTGVSWDSAISRLEAYDAMIDSEDKEIRQFGESLYGAAEEANLLGEAVYEAFSSESFQDLYQKRDDYVNSFGKFDATGIKKMQTESSTLARLLDTGKISANGLATALNTLEDTGSLDGLTSAVLELISEFDSLGEVMSDAHEIVSNFDPGIDTGEGEDFVKKNYEAVKEYWDNYEVGNEQLINYLKLYAGEDRWNELSTKYEGDLEKIERAILNGDKNHSAMSLFAEGFEKAWIKGANKGYSKDGISLGWNGDLIDLDIGDKTTDEVVTWLQEVYGISEEYAKLMLTDFENYSADLRRDLARNDWNKALPEFIGKKTRDNGSIVLTQEELNTIASARGVTSDQVLKEIKQQASDVRVFDRSSYTDEEGITNYEKALQDWVTAAIGTRDEKGELETGDFKDYLKETGDNVNELAGAVTDMQSSGIPLSDTQEMLYSKVAGTDGQYTYKGVELTDKDTKTLDSFVNKMAEIDQDEQWTKVGNAICRGWFEEYDRRNNTNDIPEQETPKSQPVMATTDTNTDNGNYTKEVDVTIDKTVNEEINTTENYDENGSNSLREEAIQREEKLKELTELPKKEAVDTIEAKEQLLDLERQQALLKRDIAQKEAVGLDTSDARSQLDTVHSKLQAVKNKLEEIREKRKITLEITTEGSIPKGLVQYGHNNYISSTGFYAGSAASGRHGTVGPKNKGGLTLTGEKGFEIAWIPSENRSMILGAQGPQLTDLPADTVVYTHEQSKKIVKQKGIPAGSHAGRHTHTGNSGSGKKKNKKNNNNNNDNNNNNNKTNDKTPHTDWLKVEIDRYNITQKINKITENIEKNAKKIDNSIDKVGTTYSKISKAVDNEFSLIKQNIEQQKNLKTSFDNALQDVVNGNRSLWVNIQSKNKKGEWESNEKSINMSKYVQKEEDGTYSINKEQIAKDYPLQVNREAVFNALQGELDKLVNGSNNAAKAIEEEEQKMEDRKQQLKETFFLWENELTKVYDLTQQLSNADATRARFAAENGMIMAQIGAGYQTAASAGKRLIEIQKQDSKLLKDRIKLTKEDIKAKREQLEKDVSSADEKSDYEKIKKENKKKEKKGTLTEADKIAEEAAKERYDNTKLANKYVTRTKQQDGSYKFNFDEDKLERDKQSGKINEATYQAIKDNFDTMVESNEEYQQSITDGFDYIAEVYQQYGEYVKTMADLESDLIEAYEKAAQKEVQKLESLNSSLTNSFKKVIDQVKRNIDNRRRQEDNAKTEQGIAQKQQRLAALRANTSGGNQAEAAQLEKEIGDAQTQYGRTLEDQMLSNMQQQADQAAQQRQEQIDLAKQQIEYNKETGVYAKQADALLKDVEGNASKIKEVLDATKDESTGKWGKQVWEAEVQNKIAEGINASSGIKTLDKQLGDKNSDINKLGKELTGKNEGVNKKDKSSGGKKSGGQKSKGQKTNAQIQTGNNAKVQAETKKSNKTINIGETTKPKELDVTADVRKKVASAIWNISNFAGWGTGNTRWSRLDNVYGKNNREKIQAYINKISKGTAKTVSGYQDYTYNKQKQKKYKKYLSGGLADSTGPAWLDGTTSKPELVLNAQDTKNFIALKDVLSGVMKDISHMSSTETYNTPTEININVNVDKIASDYDVDKLAKRLKNDIVKDMNYRNVTQVRNFR